MHRLTICLLAVVALAAEDLPYGHPDFYPTPERPTGLRGDGSGHFTGASVPTSWDWRTGENMVWQTKLPNWGYSSPIVVGDKIFVTADWNRLLCYDARDGELLWERENWTFDVVAESDEEKAELKKRWDALVDAHSQAWEICWEMAWRHFQLDMAKAAKAGEAYEYPGGYSWQGPRKKSDYLPELWHHLTEAEQQALVQRMGALSDAEVQAIEDRLAELTVIRDDKDYSPSVSAYVDTLDPFRRGTKSQASKEWQENVHKYFKDLLVPHGLHTDFWNGWLSTSFPTPCSDGEHVYVFFGQNQVVCYDLEGNRKWLKVYFDPEKAGTRPAQNHSASPYLMGDLLITIHGNDQNEGPTIWALDKTNGELVWKYHSKHLGSYGHPYAQITPMWIDGHPIIVAGNGNILDASNGKVIMTDLITNCGPPVVHGNKAYYLSGGGQTGDGVRCAVEISKSGDGSFTGEMLWAVVPAPKDPSDKKYKRSRKHLDYMMQHMPESEILFLDQAGEASSRVGSLWFDGHILVGGNPQISVDPATGIATEHKIQWPRVDGHRLSRAGKHRGHLIRTAKHIFGTGEEAKCASYTATHPVKIAGIGYCGSLWMRQLMLGELPLEEVLTAIRERHYMPYWDDWTYFQTTPYPQGNRLYIRSRDSLFCIGDPAKPYHSPAGTPAAARTAAD